MPVLAGFIGSLFASLVSLFGVWLTKKTALVAAVITVSTTITVGLGVAIAAAISSVLASVSIHAYILQGMATFMPSNLPFCVGAVFAAEATAAVYRWNRWNLVLAINV